MRTKHDLHQLFREGQLGQFLASRFGGIRGRVDAVADSDVMIGFPSEKATPNIRAIILAVSDFFRNQGFRFNLSTVGDRSMFAMISLNETSRDDLEGGQNVSINITTGFPLTPGEGRNHIRLTTTIIP